MNDPITGLNYPSEYYTAYRRYLNAEASEEMHSEVDSEIEVINHAESDDDIDDFIIIDKEEEFPLSEDQFENIECLGEGEIDLLKNIVICLDTDDMREVWSRGYLRAQNIYDKLSRENKKEFDKSLSSIKKVEELTVPLTLLSGALYALSLPLASSPLGWVPLLTSLVTSTSTMAMTFFSDIIKEKKRKNLKNANDQINLDCLTHDEIQKSLYKKYQDKGYETNRIERIFHNLKFFSYTDKDGHKVTPKNQKELEQAFAIKIKEIINDQNIKDIALNIKDSGIKDLNKIKKMISEIKELKEMYQECSKDLYFYANLLARKQERHPQVSGLLLPDVI